MTAQVSTPVSASQRRTRGATVPTGLTDAIKSAAQAWPASSLAAFRHDALAAWQDIAWPGRKNEAWRYVPVSLLDKRAAAAWQPSATQTAVAQTSSLPLAALKALHWQWVDGALTQSPDTLPQGLRVEVITPSDSAADLLGQIKPKHHVMGLVNDLLAEQVWVIEIAANTHIEQPLILERLFAQAVDTHSRVVVRVGAGAKVTLIEKESDAPTAASALNTAFVEYELGEKAELTHCRFALQRSAMNIGGSHFRLHGEAQLFSTLVALGSPLSRVDVDIEHAGEQANAKFNAVYLLRGQEFFDLHATVEHAVPNGTTEENIRGIVADQAKAAFNGRIHIHRDAQKTLAELNNRNLLLSRQAQINTKPELEIYADDVRCAHGATVAELDDTALYYLQSRGIDPLTAKMMLNIGFINELVGDIHSEPLQEWLRAELDECFALMNQSSATV